MGLSIEDLDSMILDAEDQIATPHSSVVIKQASQVILLAHELRELKLLLEKKEISEGLYRRANMKTSELGLDL